MKLFQLFLACLFALPATAQHIVFPLDNTQVSIDGALQNAEWEYARKAVIPTNVPDSITVLYKHDNTAMYFAFAGKLESANALFPEILMDAANAGGASWSNGQWWLHVSATDCEHNGAYGVYDDCKLIQPGWEAGPNFTAGAPATDTVEIRIPFAKVGFNTATMDTMGIAFVATNTANVFELFPATANRNQPATWAKATFSKIPADVSATEDKKRVVVYPNPVTDDVFIEGLEGEGEIVITDLFGRTILSHFTTDRTAKIALQHLAKGWYIIKVANMHSGNHSYKIYRK